MKTLSLLGVTMILFSSVVLSQDALGTRAAFRQFSPVTLTAGTAMSARTSADALDDTTRSVDTRGYSYVGLTLITAANDSTGLKVSYQGSHNGVTWDPVFVLIDSLTSTGSVGVTKGFPLPAKGLGYPWVRFRVEGTSSAHSSNPSTTVTSQIIKRY